MTLYCPHCGEELGDFTPCGCEASAAPRRREKVRKAPLINGHAAIGGMRGMMARKMAREAAKKGKV